MVIFLGWLSNIKYCCNRQRYESVSSEGEDLSPTNISAEDIEVFSQHPHNTQTKHFYFYQGKFYVNLIK